MQGCAIGGRGHRVDHRTIRILLVDQAGVGLYQQVDRRLFGLGRSMTVAAYFKYHQGTAQLCWAHLKRNILGLRDFAKTKEAERFCRDALALYARLFRLWRKFQSQLIDRDQLIRRSIPVQKRWFALAQRHLDSQDKEVRNLATALFLHCERLFTFLEHPGVEPTNNRVERALRIGVQWRKTSFGNRSAKGEVATARLLTVTQTCRLQRRNALDYLGEAIVCHRRRQPVPSLLPART